ncbi:hypothetical protein VE01_10102 [Pseudogymnoascus verrucosus]|uniref:Wax synthase domain-containing protein n=1 Tax=Pseudogymnoascus verrucosus TaxID=342668 RepID=A0A1B8G8H4_9PEZI|nr:uncharacterized protein VE01_10102 [Pseudogymnoascus verrucosus]OBT92139.1 hypothetical protein VE01_10102 [Pseudogymnoascus verrucosus]
MAASILPFDIPPSFRLLAHDFGRSLAYLLLPLSLLYLSLYFSLKGYKRVYGVLTLGALVGFATATSVAPINCPPAASLMNFGVAVGVLKSLDIFARRHHPRTYAGSAPLPPSLLALLLTTELRYESFTPNPIRVSTSPFSEPTDLALHIAAFAALQMLPQEHAVILALQVLLTIYILWTTLQLILRYHDSPPLFGPLYQADSLGGFWAKTWHNAFASPCTSLAYHPVRRALSRIGLPIDAARAGGLVAAFALMGAFHVYALSPLIAREGLRRVWWFFVGNGVAVVFETGVWGKESSMGRGRRRGRAVLAWAFEIGFAAWVVRGCGVPEGLGGIRWGEVCEIRQGPVGIGWLGM